MRGALSIPAIFAFNYLISEELSILDVPTNCIQLVLVKVADNLIDLDVVPRNGQEHGLDANVAQVDGNGQLKIPLEREDQDLLETTHKEQEGQGDNEIVEFAVNMHHP